MNEDTNLLNSQARTRFSSHVQSIAFNLTLSRYMIDMLWAVRDYGWPREEEFKEKPEEFKNVARMPNGAIQSIKMFRALENRGLIIHTQPRMIERPGTWAVQDNDGSPTFVLSKAGELVCEMLVEAGLIPAKKPLRKENAA